MIRAFLAGKLIVIFSAALSVFVTSKALSEEYWVSLPSGISARSGSGNDFSKIEDLKFNTEVELLERNGDWSRVLTPSGKEVWVFHALLIEKSLASKQPDNDQIKLIEQPDDSHFIVDPKDGLNARSGPGTRFDKVGKFDHKMRLKELERNGDWSKVRTPDDSEVWVHNGFLKKIEFVSPQQLLDKIREKYGMVGMGVGILKDGEFYEYVSGLRQIDRPDNPIQKGDLWHFGSSGKSMTALLIAELVAKKQLGWNTPLKKLFPEISRNAKTSDFGEITIEQLSSHTSGFFSDTQFKLPNTLQKKLRESIFNIPEDRGVVVNQVAEAGLNSPPNSKYNYSNYNYITLGRIIDIEYSTSWEKIIRQNLFDRLSMKTCGFGAPGYRKKNRLDYPWQHRFQDGSIFPVKPSLYADNSPFFGSAGRIHCSIADWIKYLQLINDGFNNNEIEYFSDVKFRKLFQTPEGIETDYTFGGWKIQKNSKYSKASIFSHTGSNTISYSFVVTLPTDNEAFVVVSNLGHRGDPKYRVREAGDELMRKLLAEFSKRRVSE